MRAEAEVLIALAHADELHPTTVKAISECLDSHPIAVLFPLTALFEAVTAWQRKLTQPNWQRGGLTLLRPEGWRLTLRQLNIQTSRQLDS